MIYTIYRLSSVNGDKQIDRRANRMNRVAPYQCQPMSRRAARNRTYDSRASERCSQQHRTGVTAFLTRGRDARHQPCTSRATATRRKREKCKRHVMRQPFFVAVFVSFVARPSSRGSPDSHVYLVCPTKQCNWPLGSACSVPRLFLILYTLTARRKEKRRGKREREREAY